jgi:hypothetical protein
MGTHVQTVRHERDRSKQETADNLGTHHRAAKPDDYPGLALTPLVALAEEDVLMERWPGGPCVDCHGRPHFK